MAAYFPYEKYREGQLELMEYVNSSIRDRQNLVIEAMSGFGKTVTILSSALEIAEKLNLSILYVCRTKREIDRVIEESKRIQSKRNFNFSFIISKHDLCLLYSNQKLDALSINALCKYSILNNLCNYWANCHFLEQSVVSSLFSNMENLTSYVSQSKIFRVCPYEIAKRRLFSSKLIILTYNCIFNDPLFTQTEKLISEPSKTIIILDEAHNLLSTVSDQYSFEINEKDIENSIEEAYQLGLIDLCRKLESLIVLYNKICFLIDKVSAHDRLLIKNEIQRFPFDEINLLHNLLSKYINGTVARSFSYTPYVIKNFAKIYMFLSYLLSYLSYQNIFMLVERKNNIPTLFFINVDPAHQIDLFLKKFWSYIMMSATVGSPKVHFSLLNIDPVKTKFYYVEPNFFTRDISVIIDKGVTTKYKQRGQQLFRRIAERIYAISKCIPYNIGVFFSSYAVLSPTFEVFSSFKIDRPIFKESLNLSLRDTNELCEKFKESKAKGGILFGVQGGRFSEGENFQDGEMRAVAVVGLSLPPPTKRLFIKMSYIKKNFPQNAFMAAMLDPAIKKAVQAAGRITRNSLPSVVLLLDSRFGSNLVLEMLPKWMKRKLIITNLDERLLEREFIQLSPHFYEQSK